MDLKLAYILESLASSNFLEANTKFVPIGKANRRSKSTLLFISLACQFELLNLTVKVLANYWLKDEHLLMFESMHPKIMKQHSMQNLADDFNPAKETPMQKVINTNVSAESLSPHSEQKTIVQVANPLSQAKVENRTTVQNRNSQNSTSSVTSINNDSVSLSPEPKVAQIDSSSLPTQTIVQIANSLSQAEVKSEPTIVQNRHSLDSIPSTSSIDNIFLRQGSRAAQINSSSLPIQAAEATVIQNRNPHIVRHLNAVAQNLTGRTVVQYSDSAIHNPAEQTVCQAIQSSSTNLNRTFVQSKTAKSKSPHPSTQRTMPRNRSQIRLSYSSIRNIFRKISSFSWNLANIKRRFFYSIKRNIARQLRSFFQRDGQTAMRKGWKQSSSNPFDDYNHNAIASAEQPSMEQYQKKQRELDLCRLCFAKELARNGKFRNAIIEAEQISENSTLFRDAQILIQSWK